MGTQESKHPPSEVMASEFYSAPWTDGRVRIYIISYRATYNVQYGVHDDIIIIYLLLLSFFFVGGGGGGERCGWSGCDDAWYHTAPVPVGMIGT